MINRVEKISLLSEMISFSKCNHSLNSIQYNFLESIAKELGISHYDFNFLIENPIIYKNSFSHSERILLFHRLILLLQNNGNKSNNIQLVKIYNYALKMGLNHECATKVLYLMDSFPNQKVPAEVLVDVFKVQYKLILLNF